MAERLLGMYVHMHWGYNHPYAARTWTLDDWEHYFSGLKALGYNLVQIWQMIDTMPIPLTESDRQHLYKIRKVITLAHKLGMTVYIGASANTIGSEKAGDFKFENRPYFECERKLNPADAGEMAQLYNVRKQLIEPLSEADGFWIIDSDPGGYKGSTPKDFAQIFLLHRKLLDELRPGIKLLYWVWDGWRDPVPYDPNWSKNPQDCWRVALKEIAQINPEPWGILACWKGHFSVIDELGLTERVLYFPYATIEDEPSFPWTYYDPDRIERAFSEISLEKFPVGAMGNAQSHCLQLPHTYLFKHFANGGIKSQIDLRKFAEIIAPGCGILLSKAWETFAGDDLMRMGTISAGLAAISSESKIRRGALAGLCFGDMHRLITDLRMEIQLKIEILRLKKAIETGSDIPGETGVLPALFKNMLVKLTQWHDCHGYNDRYYGTFRNLLHPVLKELSAKIPDGELLARALDEFDKGSHHGAFRRLLDSLLAIAG